MTIKLVSIISVLPTYTKLGALYPLLGSLNSACLNTAQRIVARDIAQLSGERREMFSIDKYNELLNELRERELTTQARHDQGFGEEERKNLQSTEVVGEHEIEHDGEDGKEKIAVTDRRARSLDRLDLLLTLRAPLLAMFNETANSLPNAGSDTADFSFEESLARQLAREFNAAERAAEEIDKALIESGAVTAEELAATDKKAFDDDQSFKLEFKHLILDVLRDRDPFDVSVEQADDALEDLGFDYAERMVKRIIPKLEEAKRQQLGRRTYDADASTNIVLIGLAINEMKKFVGPSKADENLAKMKQMLAA